MQVVILCGGMGTRAYPHTQRIPKALMEINGRPIVEEVMRIYAAQGYRDFILSCGYLKEAIFEQFRSGYPQWNVRCVDTGADADTGDRVYRLRDHLGPTFHVTYCDGLGDIDLAALVAHHQSHSALATVTATQLRSQYGLIYTDAEGVVTGFDEKPVLPDYWINGGFIVMERRAFDVWPGHNLERDVLPALAQQSQLRMHRHLGFWRSMDTYKDQQELSRLWPPYAERFAAPLEATA
jgi:glucose-1-phosphate cytidylyltransferase